MTTHTKNPLSGSLIVVPFGLPFSWSADYEYQTAAYLGRKNTVVAYLVHEGVSLVKWILVRTPLLVRRGPLYIYRPVYVVPFQRISVIASINYWLATAMLHIILRRAFPGTHRHKIFWTFSLQFSVPPHWFPREYFSVYDCIDSVPSGIGGPKRRHIEAETRILRHANVTLVNSRVQQERLTGRHPRIFLVPEGLFVPPLRPQLTEPADLTSLPRPRVLFLGNINARMDMPSLEHMVSSMPDVSFVFVGRIDPWYDPPQSPAFLQRIGELRKRKNFHVLGERPRQDVYAYITHCDVGIIPYDISQEFVRLSYPMKLFEFLYMGKQVLASAIQEIQRYHPEVTIYRSPAEASEKLHRLLSSRLSGRQVQRLKNAARAHTLEQKMRLVRKILAAYFPEYF